MNTKFALSFVAVSVICGSALTIIGCETQPKVTPDHNNNTSYIQTTLLSLAAFNGAESNYVLKPDGARTRHNENNDGMSVTFLNNVNTAKLSVIPNKTWKLGNLPAHNLALDVKNLSQGSTHLYVQIENAQGKSQRHSISLKEGYQGTIFVPLSGKEAKTETGFWGDAPIWPKAGNMMVWRSWRSDQVELSEIAKIDIFTIGLLEEKSINISNMRIRKNPPSDPKWLNGIVDKFGQYTLVDFPMKVRSEAHLLELAEKELSDLQSSPGPENRSIYGGFTKGPALKASGYFRTEKVDGKWWMVDPLGNVFFSHGPANVRLANMTTLTGVDYNEPSIRIRHNDEVTPEDSMGIIKIDSDVKSKAYLISELRNKMFTWLPEYDDPLAEHYSYRRSTHKGAVPYGETFSFYRANLQRRYGNDGNDSFLRKWEEITLERMRDWGFTSFGNWVDPAFFKAKKVPYFANGWIIGDFKTLSGYKNHWGLMPDPFDPVFAERTRHTIDVLAKKVDNSPWCVGIFIDNEKSWGERQGSVAQRYGVILDALSKTSSQSPAKAAFTKTLQQKYGNISALNEAWSTSISDWDSFANSLSISEYTDALVSDLSSLLASLGEQYFKVVHNTLEQAMPNHLYMGARMANWGMPDEIIKASLKYSDVLSFNIYEEGVQEHAWKFLEEVDLPTVIGEFHIGTATDSGLFNPGIVHAANQQDRANMYKDYMQSVISKPYMVGAHWFQYIDEPLTGRAFDGENANIGLVNVTDVPYPELSEAIKEVTYNMYQTRLNDSEKKTTGN